MDNLLEALLAELNRNIFYREFSFSKNAFNPSPGVTKEFADHVVWIDELLIIYQLKQRATTKGASESAERNWFKRKVLRRATKQVKDTLEFLEEHPSISIQNQRDHVFDVNSRSLKYIIKLVVYAPSKSLPESCLSIRHRIGSKTGFMHIIPWEDYVGVCTTLITPAELVEYFQFREAVIQRWSQEVNMPGEPALVGQFLSGDDSARPSEESIQVLERLQDDYAQFDVSYLLSGIGDRIEYHEGTGTELDYYKILAEFAKLHRGELKEVKKRVVKCLEVVGEGDFMSPTRIVAPTTGCGFVFIPMVGESFERRKKGLKNLTYAAKYEQRLQRQVGVSFAKEGDFVHIDWCFLDSACQYDAQVEGMLRGNNPFAPLRAQIKDRYAFDE